jgi:hypothetical protein
LNAFHGKDLVKEYIGLEYKNTDQGTGRGFEMAKLEVNSRYNFYFYIPIRNKVTLK